MNTHKPKVILIVGPTASGKTSLGVAVAKHFNGEVVSCDSMQIYNNMPIASAAPKVEETDGIVHHLVGFADPSVKFSVAQFVSMATEAINDILSRGKMPVIVGGTGLYVDSLISGVEFCDEDNAEIREKLEREAESIGFEAMLERLRKVDPETAAKYHINDRKRIIRALEIYEIHGRSKSELDRESKRLGARYDAVWIGLTFRDRSILYDRINRRVDIMLEEGVLDEAGKAFSDGSGKTAVQAIGHKEFFPYFKGEVELVDAVENLKTETRRYAKRQLTWFRRNQEINWIYADETTDVVSKAIETVNRNFEQI